MSSTSCSWCHATNTEEVDYCRKCGHHAHRPRSDCGCVDCQIREDVEYGLAALAAGPQAWAEWNASMLLDLDDGEDD